MDNLTKTFLYIDLIVFTFIAIFIAINKYFTKSEVDGFLADMNAGNGLWDVTPATLDAICEDIAEKFDFTVAQAAL